VIADTDTARYAHVLLPALAWGEKDGTVTNSERRISRQRAVFAAPGQARADWAIMADVAARMGWGKAFAYSSPAAVFREYAAMTSLASRHGKLLDLTALAGLDDDEYEAMEPFLWGGAHPLARRFPTPSGKARLVSVRQAAPPADAGRPLRLNTGRYRDQWHTMTRTGLSPTLSQHRREPLVEVHPADAATHGLSDGDLARLSTAAGSTNFRVAVNDAQRPGDLFVPMHWTDQLSAEGRANLLALAETDPLSGQPGFKNTPATIAPVRPEWRGFLVTRTAADLPQVLWWTRSRVAGGWLHELAGTEDLDVDTLLPPGERLEAVDLARGMRRVAVLAADGRLEAALYLTRRGHLPPRDWVAAQLGAVPAGPELLAGRPAAPQPDRGPIVCVCLGVGANAIRSAACAGAATVAAVGSATGAGTNCGSCRPAIARLIGTALNETEEAAA